MAPEVRSARRAQQAPLLVATCAVAVAGCWTTAAVVVTGGPVSAWVAGWLLVAVVAVAEHATREADTARLLLHAHPVLSQRSVPRRPHRLLHRDRRRAAAR